MPLGYFASCAWIAVLSRSRLSALSLSNSFNTGSNWNSRSSYVEFKFTVPLSDAIERCDFDCLDFASSSILSMASSTTEDGTCVHVRSRNEPMSSGPTICVLPCCSKLLSDWLKIVMRSAACSGPMASTRSAAALNGYCSMSASDVSSACAGGRFFFSM